MTGSTEIVHLRGHGSTAAELSVTPYSSVGPIIRITRYVVVWIGASVAILLLTFDSLPGLDPFVIGVGYVYKSVRARYRVSQFEGRCARCAEILRLEPGFKIPLPYDLVC